MGLYTVICPECIKPGGDGCGGDHPTELSQSIDKHNSELTALRAELGRSYNDYKSLNDASIELTIERDRYKAALEQIVGHSKIHAHLYLTGETDAYSGSLMAEIAKEALKT